MRELPWGALHTCRACYNLPRAGLPSRDLPVGRNRNPPTPTRALSSLRPGQVAAAQRRSAGPAGQGLARLAVSLRKP